MAAGDAPDIIYTFVRNVMLEFARQGGLTDLTELMQTEGKDIKEFVGEDVLNFGVVDGKQVSITSKSPMTQLFVSVIRKDWLDQLGLPIPQTTEEFYNVLKEFKAKNPGNLDGKGIPYGLALHRAFWQTMVESFRTEMTEEEFYTLPKFLQPGYKDGLRFVNTLYNEGLVSLDFALDKDGSVLQQDIVKGVVGSFTMNMGQPFPEGGLYDSLRETVPGAELAAMDPFTNYEGKRPKEIGNGVGLYNMVPKYSERAKEAVMYLNWMADPDVAFTLENGVEGVKYNLDENGFPVAIETEEANKSFWSSLAMDMHLIHHPGYFKDESKAMEYRAIKYGANKQLYLDSCEAGSNDGFVNPTFSTIIESETQYATTLQEKTDEIFVKTVTAKPEEFDSVYDDLVEEYMSMGGQKVMEEKVEAYKNMK